MDKKIKQKKVLWKFPWGYPEGFFIAFFLMIIGFGIEYISGGKGIGTLSWKMNAIVGLLFLNILVTVYFFFGQSNIVKFLSSIPASISAISVFTFVVLLMGLTPQFDNEVSEFSRRLGLSHITSSWQYLIIQIYFLINLGFVTIKRIIPFQWKNLGFILNHAGVWITIVAASLGSGDLKRLHMQLDENKATWIARDEMNNAFQLPFAMKLLNFDIEEYNPKIALVDNISGKIVNENGVSAFTIEKGVTQKLLDFEISIDEYFPLSATLGDEFKVYTEKGAAPSAYIKVKNNVSNDTSSGWISSGSFAIEQRALPISEKYSLYMLSPEAKKYSSTINFTYQEFTDTDTIHVSDTIVIEVNKPFKYNGWKMYQVSYDEYLGKWSETSIIEIVSDPWLPIVYFGIFLMLAGAVYIFWTGQKISLKEEKT